MGQEAGPHLVVGTAGHIDHGKTTLVRALTGVDTDRLPEEKRRGITIVLGFAPLDLPSGLRVGLIDVPGHERFVKTMVAGAGGIDLALLVVAADEGVMPQTREHLEILTLLGVERGVVALTKVDRAAGLIELAEEDIRASLAKSPLANAPIIRVSAPTGVGIAELLATLDGLAQSAPRRAPGGPAFLPIDRAFNVKGFGAVVTGTLLSGRIGIGDELELLPPLAGRPLARLPKVRGLHVFGQPVQDAWAGQRVAVNLAGVDLEQIGLGQALATPASVVPTRRLTVRLEHLASHDRPMRTGSKGLFAIGTKEIEAGMTLLEVDQLMPGERGYATIRLSGPIVTLPARRFIWRSFEQKGNAGRTIAGGVVLDPEPGRRRRKTEETSTLLAALDAHFNEEGALGPAIAALVAERKTSGAEVAELARRLDSSPAAIQKGAAKAQVIKALDRWVSPRALEALGKRIASTITAFHAEQPFRAGLPLAELASRVGRRATPPIVECAARLLIEAKAIATGPDGYRLPSHRPQLELDPEKKQTVLAALKATPLEPPTGKELEAKTGMSQKSLIDLLTALAKTGEVIHAGLGLHFERSAFDEAKVKLAAHVEAHGAITTAEAKTLFGISRKYLIPLLEAFDKRGFTVRQGESRKVKKL